jgi:hypothetical protein
MDQFLGVPLDGNLGIGYVERRSWRSSGYKWIRTEATKGVAEVVGVRINGS